MSSYNHVGRPTNEEVLKKRKFKIIKIIFFLLIVILLLGAFYFFVLKNKDINGNGLNASTQYSSFASRMSSKPVFTIDSYSLKSNALQGAIGYENRIYYVTTLTAGRQTNISGTNRKNVGSAAYYYSLDSKKNNEFKTINNGMSTEYADYKNNDATVNTKEGKVYFLYYANDYSDSKIVSKVGSKTKTINTKEYTKKVFYNISYSSSYEEYVSIDKNAMYFYTLDNDKVNLTSTCKLDSSLQDQNAVKYDGKIYNTKKVLQGTAMVGKLLYVVYQTRYYDQSNSDKILFETNQIALFDTRNCSFRKKIGVSKTYNFGKSTFLKYELESIFFMNGKLYLGYNNEYYNKISFYTLNTTNTSTIQLTSKKTDKEIILKGKIKTQDNHSGLLYYSFCKYSDRTKCKFRSISEDGNYKLIFDDYEITYKLDSDEKGTYYFHTLDAFGKRKKASVKI